MYCCTCPRTISRVGPSGASRMGRGTWLAHAPSSVDNRSRYVIRFMIVTSAALGVRSIQTAAAGGAPERKSGVLPSSDGSASHTSTHSRGRDECPLRHGARSLTRAFGLGRLLFGKQFFLEAELGEIADATRIEHAVEVVAFVLHHARVKTVHLAHEALATLIEAAVTQSRVTRHQPAHARHAQTALPILIHLRTLKLELGVDEYGDGDGLDLGITRIGLEAEDHQPTVNADLRRGEACTVQRIHGVEHIPDQRIERRGVELGDRLRHALQARIAHTQYFMNPMTVYALCQVCVPPVSLDLFCGQDSSLSFIARPDIA